MENKGRLTELQEDWGKLCRLFAFLWGKRSMFIKYISVAIVVGLVYVFSIPKTYSTSVMLAPETSGSSLSAGMSSLASMAGVNLNGMAEDALAVELYPSIVSSKDFLLQLFDARVHSVEQEIDTTYADYLAHFQKVIWWNYPVKLIGAGIKKLLPKKEEMGNAGLADKASVRFLTEKENVLCQAMQNQIVCSVDKLSGVLTVTVSDQNAEISAIMADTVVNKLNRFILDYRTHKARSDYEYVTNLCKEAEKNYLEAQSRYANFTATHVDVYSPLIKAQVEYLQNESQLAYLSYSQLKTQQQTAHAKVLETTPVYTVVESAYVPERAASPKKMLTLLAFAFLAVLIATCKLFYQYYLKSDVQD